jgi:hypothetical protein
LYWEAIRSNAVPPIIDGAKRISWRLSSGSSLARIQKRTRCIRRKRK